MRDLQIESLRPLADGLRGLRVFLWGFSHTGFPGGDGVAEALDVLPEVGIIPTYAHAKDPEAEQKIAAGGYDVSIVTNTRVADVDAWGDRIWHCAKRRAYWFWDLRPGDLAAPLHGRADHVFLSYAGEWTSPQGTRYHPEQWVESTGARVHYCPQASSLRNPETTPDAPRVLFIGDLNNSTYHQGRSEMCRRLGAQVINARPRDRRLAVEARMSALYPSSRYCLSMSPLAPGYTSVRTYSILACGGLLLLHRFPDADRLFVDGDHAVIFDTAEEATERMRELDENPAERAHIAAAGRRLHATRHTVAHRILDICRRVTGLSNEFAGWI